MNPLTAIADAQQVAGPDVGWIEGDGALVEIDRLSDLPQLLQAPAHGHQAQRIIRAHRQQRQQHREGMIGLTGAQQGKTHPHPQLGILRGPLQAFAIGSQGLLQLPLQAKHVAKMKQNPALLANRQRQLPQHLLPLLGVAMVGQQHAQVLSRHGIAGLQIEGALIGRHG